MKSTIFTLLILFLCRTTLAVNFNIKSTLTAIESLQNRTRSPEEDKSLRQECESIVKQISRHRTKIDTDTIDQIVSVLETSANGYVRFWLSIAVNKTGHRAIDFLPRIKARTKQIVDLYEASPLDQRPTGVNDLYILTKVIHTLEKQQAKTNK